MNFEDIIVNIAPLLQGKDLLFFSRVNKMYYNISNKIIQHKTIEENIEEWMSITTMTYSCVLHPSVNIDKFFNKEISDTYNINTLFKNIVIIKYNELSIKLHKNKSIMVSGRYHKNNNYLDILFNTNKCSSEPIIRLVNVKFRIPKITQDFINTHYPKAVDKGQHYVFKNKNNYNCLIYKNGNIILICKNFGPCFDFYKEINTHYNNYNHKYSKND
jgi:hypothetical protein